MGGGRGDNQALDKRAGRPIIARPRLIGGLHETSTRVRAAPPTKRCPAPAPSCQRACGPLCNPESGMGSEPRVLASRLHVGGSASDHYQLQTGNWKLAPAGRSYGSRLTLPSQCTKLLEVLLVIPHHLHVRSRQSRAGSLDGLVTRKRPLAGLSRVQLHLLSSL